MHWWTIYIIVMMALTSWKIFYKSRILKIMKPVSYFLKKIFWVKHRIVEVQHSPYTLDLDL